MPLISGVPDTDLLIELWPSRPLGVGGQHVGVTRQGVKITHLPTDIQACCQYERSGFKNRQVALDMIEAALTSPKLGYLS